MSVCELCDIKDLERRRQSPYPGADSKMAFSPAGGGRGQESCRCMESSVGSL